MGSLPPELGRRLTVLTGTDSRAYAEELRRGVATIARQERFAALLRKYAALGDKRRLLALGLLKRHGELCGCELQAALEVSHATISHHMDELREAGLIESSRRGKWMYYRLTEAGAAGAP